jgi:hypothetical protein
MTVTERDHGHNELVAWNPTTDESALLVGCRNRASGNPAAAWRHYVLG